MCDNLITVRQGKPDEAQVPCGRCTRCFARRISGWSFRLMMEDRHALSSHFITLTYATQYLPRSTNKFATLSKRHVQLFFKRLRKINAHKLKYYCVGEYGTRFRRPHYHIILFNAEVSTISRAWCNKKGRPIGNIYYGTVTGASVGYCLKYMSKPKGNRMHRRDDRQVEFSLMSKALGAAYLTEAMRKWHEAKLEERMYCVLEGGKKISMPRYYKDKIYTENMRKIVSEAQMYRIEQEQLKERQLYLNDDTYWHNKHAAIKASYSRMHFKALQGRE
ncbi:MAG: replication initiator protein [Microviridae sp.]|nr:MAG: replication initiator protein [Microviridae sp.]